MSCVDREFASFISEMLMYAEFSVFFDTNA